MFPSHFRPRFSGPPRAHRACGKVSGRSTIGTRRLLRLDVDYARSQTLRGDLAILARTVPALLRC